MTPDIKPEKGSERVKSWVYAVLNPVIDSLRRETALLATGNLSWRAHTKRCEYIRPVDELIDASSQPILDDFLAEDPTLRDQFNKHDAALARLEETAYRFFQGLVQSSLFRKEVDECLKRYDSLRASNPTYPDLQDLQQEKIPEYVAEYLVNQTKSLPRHYTMYPFWEAFWRKFWETSGPEFEAFQQRQTFVATEDSAQTLLKTSESLGLYLVSLRLTLCREYDIPAARLEPSAMVSSENALSRFR